MGQSDENFTAEHIGVMAGIVQHFAFQHAQQVEQGNILQYAGVDAGHIVAGDVGTGQNAVQRAILRVTGRDATLGYFWNSCQARLTVTPNSKIGGVS